jgi:ribosomal-protein-serine acetyltransferase
MNPSLRKIPLSFETERLVLRCPQTGDGPALNAAVLESLNELRPWFFWADHPHTLEESETFACEAYIRYLQRTALDWLIFPKGSDSVIGAIGLWSIDFGAGHSVYEDEELFARVQQALAPYPWVILLLPSLIAMSL